MRLHGMSHHDGGGSLPDYLLELGQHPKVETSTLRNDVNRQSQLASCPHKFVPRFALVLKSFKGHHTAFDTRKLCVLLAEFINRAMELQNILGDGIDRCRFDY